MTFDGLYPNVYDSSPSTESTLLENQITLIASTTPNTAEVWRGMKEEAPDVMTLEDFLVKNGAVEQDDVKVPKTERLGGGVFAFDPIPSSPHSTPLSVMGLGNGAQMVSDVVAGGRGKRARALLEPLDKASQQKQNRMIKNRESAARSRERKQAYQVELESLAGRLEEENERLLMEKAERTKERFNQLMEKVIPIEEKRRPPRVLRRVCSVEW